MALKRLVVELESSGRHDEILIKDTAVGQSLIQELMVDTNINLRPIKSRVWVSILSLLGCRTAVWKIPRWSERLRSTLRCWGDSVMRKRIITASTGNRRSHSEENWLDLEEISAVELTSENSNFPIESALAASKGSGWRAAEPGEQVIRIILDKPRSLRRVRLEFSEADIERTQEFTLRWSQPDGPLREIVRQQWNFSPQGSTNEIEDYHVQLEKASVLELTIKPDLTPDSAFASLAVWRLA